MIVLIDAGNTRVKFGWVRSASGEREAATLALLHTELDQLNAWLEQLDAPPTAALGVNVAGSAIAHAIEALLARYSCPVSWITSQSEILGIRNAYATPSQLGADRWVSMIGIAKREHAPVMPLILATFGTATTIDTLSPRAGAAIVQKDSTPPTDEGEATTGRDSPPDGDLPERRIFQGGLIFPGPALMRSSLNKGTANLPEAVGDTAPYPTHTHQAITTGIAAAQAGAVVRQWLVGLEHYGQAPHVYSAGGGWPIVQDETQRLLALTQTHLGLPLTPIEWLASPVLDGLACLVEGEWFPGTPHRSVMTR